MVRSIDHIKRESQVIVQDALSEKPDLKKELIYFKLMSKDLIKTIAHLTKLSIPDINSLNEFCSELNKALILLKKLPENDIYAHFKISLNNVLMISVGVEKDPSWAMQNFGNPKDIQINLINVLATFNLNIGELSTRIKLKAVA